MLITCSLSVLLQDCSIYNPQWDFSVSERMYFQGEIWQRSNLMIGHIVLSGMYFEFCKWTGTYLQISVLGLFSLYFVFTTILEGGLGRGKVTGSRLLSKLPWLRIWTWISNFSVWNANLCWISDMNILFLNTRIRRNIGHSAGINTFHMECNLHNREKQTCSSLELEDLVWEESWIMNLTWNFISYPEH